MVPALEAFVRVLIPVFVAILALKAAADERSYLKVLVLDPTSEVVETSVLTSIAGLVSVEISHIKGLDVLSSSDVKKIAALEADKMAVGCDETSCLTELAGAIGARFVVFGDASKLGTLLVLNLSLFDAANARSVGRVSVQAKSLEELPALLSPAVRDLLRAALQDAGMAANATVPTVSPSARKPGDGPLQAVWTWGLVATGSAVALGGIAYDSMAPSSGDGRLDPLDAVGPALVGIGGIAVVAAFLAHPFGGDDA